MIYFLEFSTAKVDIETSIEIFEVAGSAPLSLLGWPALERMIHARLSPRLKNNFTGPSIKGHASLTRRARKKTTLSTIPRAAARDDVTPLLGLEKRFLLGFQTPASFDISARKSTCIL